MSDWFTQRMTFVHVDLWAHTKLLPQRPSPTAHEGAFRLFGFAARLVAVLDGLYTLRRST